MIVECESRLSFVQEKLKIEISTDEIESKIAQLKASILREEPGKIPEARNTDPTRPTLLEEANEL